MNHDEFKRTFNEAMRLKNAGSYQAAVDILSSLLDAGHHSAAVNGMLGLILYYDLADARSALPFLGKAVAISPSSERASIGLFHALLATGQVDEAFAEARRYLSDHTSDAYEEYLRDVLKSKDPT